MWNTRIRGLIAVDSVLKIINKHSSTPSNWNKKVTKMATTMEQLKENIGTGDIDLSDEIIDKINLIHANNPNPTP